MLLPVKSLQLVTILYWGFLLSFNSYIVNGLSGKEPFLHRRLVDSPRDSKMTADATSTTTTKTIVVPERYSIAFFCNANKNVEIKNFFTMEPARYPPINAHEYLTQRLAATIQTT
mmetsp:Transcript_28322/g.60945  ORF Transcript_28322/g.60945 Transcript_28322/m.60945 type:complete len:115 (+) Transcript_28322:317-661(+)